ncbi:MAG: hypothetical protein WED04_04865 [Promethearchaeati archaeon SRVP18_Atabeyarchaeia-1]
MTDKGSIAPRVIGVILAALLFIAIAAMILTTIVPFNLDVGPVLSTLITANDYSQAGLNASYVLWSYRGIDVMVQALLLSAAAIGAAALFRLESGRKEEKEA